MIRGDDDDVDNWRKRERERTGC